MWLQQDICPAHFAVAARRVIHELFPQRWIGQGGTVTWPARSPDLSLNDLFLWGRIKEIVYNEHPTTSENMKQRIRTACESLSNAEVLR